MSSPSSAGGAVIVPEPILVGLVARPLLGKVALITGGSRGIGAAIVRSFAAAGADVAFSHSSASQEAADSVARSAEATGQRCLAVCADHAVQSEVTQLVAQVVAHFGRLDILVNNCGVAWEGSICDPAFQTPEAVAQLVDRQFAINVTSVATAVRAASAHLPSGGRIINIGSRSALRVPCIGLADYTATKSALVGYTKGWARDFGSRGVTVNLVQPGITDTTMNPISDPAVVAAAAAAPVGRHGTPEEIAAAVLFLATPAASFVNAAILTVDGGITA